MSIFQTNIYHEQSNNILNNQFIYSQLLIDALLQLKSTKLDKRRLIHFCKEKYKGIHHELKNIEEFEQNYSSTNAIDWYMKDSFLYQIFHKALRSLNIDLLFLFRFLIHDIREQISQHQYTTSIRVYRGQVMSRAEINLFENSMGRLISINSFFSTYLNRDVALNMLNEVSLSKNTERVMFEIDANPTSNSKQPFGLIVSKNNCETVEQVLFTLGSVFRINKINQQQDGLWVIQLVLCGDNDEQLNKILKSFMIDESQNKINILSFGNFLRKIGDLKQAEKFFIRLLREMSNNHRVNADCYYALGCIEMDKNIYDFSLNLHRKSLEIKLKVLSENDPSLVDSYNSIGDIHLKKSQYKEAYSSYSQALSIAVKFYGDDNLNVAVCYTNLGGICQKQENYIDALEYYKKALDIRQKHMTISQPELGISHNNIAIIYSCLNHYDLALEHYRNALNILKNTLPPLHPEIAVCYCGLGLVYEQKGQMELALSCYDRTVIIYRQTLSSKHPHVIQIEEHIQNLSSKLGFTIYEYNENSFRLFLKCR